MDLSDVQRPVAQAAAAAIQGRWTPRLSVFLWDRLDLSRSECENLRNLISFKYHPDIDKNLPLHMWENPDDPSDFVEFPVLPGRYAREREFAAIAAEAEIKVSASGNCCQRDACAAASEMYSAYSAAMRSNFSEDRPAQPTFLFDGTGQSLGKPLCHAELGSADFINDCRQSRKTLQPLQASEGTDHAVSIRETMDYATKTFNELIKAASITLENGQTIPARPIASADFQAVKAMTATSEQTHAVWCTCLDCDDRQHNYSKETINLDPASPASIDAAYERMIQFIERDANGPKCRFKTFDEQCCWNHVCPSIARGGRFKRFKCSLCDYHPTEAQWRKDMANFFKLSDGEQKAARKTHRENGETEYVHRRHQFGELFMYPILHLDFKDIGVDMLHLVYLNAFKHLFKYTVHEPLPGKIARRRTHTSGLPDHLRVCACCAEAKKKILRDYLKNAGFYSYNAAADDEDPVTKWIGREAKRFLSEAHIHLPFLLQLAAAPPDVCDAAAEDAGSVTGAPRPCLSDLSACSHPVACIVGGENGMHEMEIDEDDDYAPTEDEIRQEEEEEPTMMQNADAWDDFLAYVALLQSDWATPDEDTDNYRKKRAVEFFNAGEPRLAIA